MIETNIIKTDRFSMKYITFGTGKEKFVILPGMSVKPVTPLAESVACAFSKFCDTYTVYLFDRKESIEDGYDVLQMAEDTAEAMRMLKICNADVFGASQGGMIAQRIAISYPELVRKLVLGSTLARQNAISRETFSRWIELANAGDPRALNRCIHERVYSENYRKKYSDVFSAMEKDGSEEDLHRFSVLAEACLSFDDYAEVVKISCPVFVIGAAQDRTLSVIGSEELAEKLQCEKYIYSEYGHAVYDEAPDYRDRMLAFFRR